MSHTHYSGDPRQITARFPSTCHTCGKPIKKGETIIYWPNGKKAGHYDCDIKDYRQSLASFEDEDRYNNVYHWSTGRAYLMKVLPFSLLFFFESPDKEKPPGKKEIHCSGETFCKKVTKNPTHSYSKFHAKLNSWKYHVTKRCLLKEPQPFGFIQIPFRNRDPNVCSRIFIPFVVSA